MMVYIPCLRTFQKYESCKLFENTSFSSKGVLSIYRSFHYHHILLLCWLVIFSSKNHPGVVKTYVSHVIHYDMVDSIKKFIRNHLLTTETFIIFILNQKNFRIFEWFFEILIFLLSFIIPVVTNTFHHATIIPVHYSFMFIIISSFHAFSSFC